MSSDRLFSGLRCSDCQAGGGEYNTAQQRSPTGCHAGHNSNIISAITTTRSPHYGTKLSPFMTAPCDCPNKETSCVLNAQIVQLGETCSLSRWSGSSSLLVIHAYGCQYPCPCNHWESTFRQQFCAVQLSLYRPGMAMTIFRLWPA